VYLLLKILIAWNLCILNCRNNHLVLYMAFRVYLESMYIYSASICSWVWY
jgi:hypothetical protein